MPRDGLREIAVRLLDEQAIAEGKNIPMESQPVAIAALSLHLARQVEEQARLTDQVETDIGEAEVDLERRRMPAPFGETLTQDQAVIAKAQKIVEERPMMLDRFARVEAAARPRLFGISHIARLDGRKRRRHHICPTASGMS